MHYANGYPTTNEGRPLYPMTLVAAYRQYVGSGNISAQRLVVVLDHELRTSRCASPGLRQEIEDIRQAAQLHL